MKKIILWMIVLLCLSVVYADESTPLVVWVENGDLVVWHDSISQVFSVGNLIFPKLSPSGEQVALLRGNYPYVESLSVIGIDGADLRDVDIRYPRQVEWQSETILWVNTYLPPTDGMLNLLPSTILYRMDLEADTVSQWDMGGAFMMTINPNRTWLSIAFAGVHQQQEGKIQLLSLLTDEMTPQLVMTFPAISNASHEGYYPPIQWMSDDVARVAIPHPDSLYPSATPLMTQLWQFQTDMTMTSLGELKNTHLLLSPVWSDDGEKLAYLEYSQQGQTFCVMDSDLSQAHYRHTPNQPEPFFSVPQTSDFLVIQNNTAVYIIGEDATPRLWATGGGAFIGDMQMSVGGAVFILLNDFSITLVYARWGEDTLYEIVEMTEYPFFDAKWE